MNDDQGCQVRLHFDFVSFHFEVLCQLISVNTYENLIALMMTYSD